MKKTFFTLSICAGFVCSAVFFSTTGCGPDKKDNKDSLTTDSMKTAGISNSYSVIPADLKMQNQASADTFSWLSFIALNWPSNTSTCSADTSNGMNILSGTGPVVWETYLAPEQVFVKQGQQPAAWCATANAASMSHIPAKVLELGQKTGVNRFIHMTSKTETLSEIDQVMGGPLVDQNGRFVRYEIKMNMDEYNFITQNNLWNKAGQTEYGKSNTEVQMPAGPSTYGPVGAMEIKASWKVLGANDDTTSFYTITAIVYNDEDTMPSPGTNPVTLGLVGLHISHRTASQSNWVWSTFEHNDNLTKSFNNPNCKDCPVNQPIASKNPQELDPNGQPLQSPTQVTRVNPIGDPFTEGINKYFQGMLQGSVWANYHLVGTQWFQFEAVAQQYLANTTMETYLQGPSPASYGNYPLKDGEVFFTDPHYQPFSSTSSSSCMGCHYTAARGNLRFNFSFLLFDTQF
jgi:hypothetical protein